MTAAPNPGYGALFRSRPFLLLWLSTVINGLGSAVTYVALPLRIYDLSGSFVALGLGFFFETLPWVVVGPILGVWSDRGDRKRLIVAATLGQAGVIVLAPFATAVWQLYVLGALSTTLFVWSTPARSAVVPEVVGRELFPSAVAVSQLTQQTLQIAGPLLGGVIVLALTPRFAFFVDAVSFVIAAALFALVAIPDAARFPRAEGEALVEQLRAAARFVRDVPALRLTLLVSLPPMLTLGMVMAMTPAFVRADLGMDAGALGLLNGLFSAGVVAAGFAVVRLREKFELRLLLATGAALFGLAFLPLLGSAALLLSCVLWLISGAGRGVISTLAQVVFALETPVGLRGRVFAMTNAATMAARMIGSLAAGTIAEAVGVRTTLALGGVVAGACALIVLMQPSAPRVPRDSRPLEL